MSYRPITDFWLMARPKVKRYGSYPAGFLERARALLGVSIHDAVLHVCGGRVRDYPYPERAVGPRDATIDLDPACEPDYLMDVTRLGVEKGDLFPKRPDVFAQGGAVVELECVRPETWPLWDGVLLDRPYTALDHAEYAVPTEAFPSNLNNLLKRCLSTVAPGRRVGVLDYVFPQPPRNGVKLVAAVAVVAGYNNRIRIFSVFERVALRSDLAPADPTEALVSLGVEPETAAGLMASQRPVHAPPLGAPLGASTWCGAPGCGLPQRFSDGGLVCANGHGRAPSLSEQPLVQPTPAQVALMREMAARPTPEGLKGKTFVVERAECVGCRDRLQGVDAHTCLPWADMDKAAVEKLDASIADMKKLNAAHAALPWPDGGADAEALDFD